MLNWDEIEVNRHYSIKDVYDLNPVTRWQHGIPTAWVRMEGPKGQFRIYEFIREIDWRCSAIANYDHYAFWGIFPPLKLDFSELNAKGKRGMDDERFEEVKRDMEANGFPIQHIERTETRVHFFLGKDDRGEKVIDAAERRVLGKYRNYNYKAVFIDGKLFSVTAQD